MLHRRFVVLTLVLSLLVIAGSAPSQADWRQGDRVVLNGGETILYLVPTAPSDCPIDYVCLWANPEYLGSLVAFRDCCAWVNLADVGFNNSASSWRNRKAVDAKIADFQDGNGNRLCLNNGSQAATMGSWDNQATSIKVFSSSAAC